MGGGVLVGGLPGVPMMQQMPGVQQLGLIGVPRFRWPSSELLTSETAGANLQLQLARAAAAQQAAGAAGLTGPAANLLAHPLLGAAAGSGATNQSAAPTGGVFLLPRLPWKLSGNTPRDALASKTLVIWWTNLRSVSLSHNHEMLVIFEFGGGLVH